MLKLEVTAERIRQIGSLRAQKQMTTAEAEAFLTLFENDLTESLERELRSFVNAKLQRARRQD